MLHRGNGLSNPTGTDRWTRTPSTAAQPITLAVEVSLVRNLFNAVQRIKKCRGVEEFSSIYGDSRIARIEWRDGAGTKWADDFVQDSTDATKKFCVLTGSSSGEGTAEVTYEMERFGSTS